MRILIAGLGSIGRRHLRNLLALGQRDVLLFRSGRSTLPDDALADHPVETDLAAALARSPDAVVVSNPTSLHLDVAIPAAAAGCHLLIEKPISDSLERVDDLREAVVRGGGQVVVGFQFRFHPTLLRARALVEEGSLGRVVTVRAHWGEYLPDWHPWEDYRRSYAARADLGGGALLTLCHPFDYLRWIFGEVEEAHGVFSGGLGLDVDAVVEAGVRFRSGVLASIHLDYLQRPPEHIVEIVGEQGRLRWDGRTGFLEVASAAGKPTSHHLEEGFDRNDLFLAEMEHFLRVASGEEDSLCTLEDGVRVQEVLEMVRGGRPRDDRR